MEKTYYEMLEVPYDATTSQIERSFFTIMERFIDYLKSPESQLIRSKDFYKEQFRYAEACMILKDKEKRADYDVCLTDEEKQKIQDKCNKIAKRTKQRTELHESEWLGVADIHYMDIQTHEMFKATGTVIQMIPFDYVQTDKEVIEFAGYSRVITKIKYLKSMNFTYELTEEELEFVKKCNLDAGVTFESNVRIREMLYGVDSMLPKVRNTREETQSGYEKQLYHSL